MPPGRCPKVRPALFVRRGERVSPGSERSACPARLSPDSGAAIRRALSGFRSAGSRVPAGSPVPGQHRQSLVRWHPHPHPVRPQAPGPWGTRLAVVRADWTRSCLVRSPRVLIAGGAEDLADLFPTISPRSRALHRLPARRPWSQAFPVFRAAPLMAREPKPRRLPLGLRKGTGRQAAATRQEAISAGC